MAQVLNASEVGVTIGKPCKPHASSAWIAPNGNFYFVNHCDHWETARVGLKPYAACASSHTIVDGILDLRRRGLTVGNLSQLTIRMSKKGQLNVGWPYEPGEVISAQMNGYYIAAVTLLDGDAFIEQFAQDRLADRNILDLVPRIR